MDWRVQAVFDPDELGGDFAYTIGLVERGLPELHIWARPPDGDDPGEDWKLSARDCAYVLNACTERLIAGRLAVGDTWTESYDGGLVRAEFTVGAAVGRLEVEALHARPDALVLPLRWSLHRPPAGALGPIAETAERQARIEWAQVVGRLDSRAVAQLPLPWQPSPAPVCSPNQQFGPLSPLVIAVGAAVATSDAERIASFMDAALYLVESHGHRYGDALIAAEARTVGRQPELRALEEPVEELVQLVAGGPHRPSRRWVAVGAHLFGKTTDDNGQSLLPGLRHVLRDALGTLLGLQVVSDVAGDASRRAGSGPWLWGSSVVAPGPLWWAPRETMAQVRRMLGPLDAEGLATLGELHEIARGTEPRSPYREATGWLRGIALAEPVGMPRPESFLLGTRAGSALLELAAGDTASSAQPQSTLAAMAAITTAIAIADVVTADRLETVATPYATLLPGLAAEIAARAAAA
jgi:hypothetical protein